MVSTLGCKGPCTRRCMRAPFRPRGPAELAEVVSWAHFGTILPAEEARKHGGVQVCQKRLGALVAVRDDCNLRSGKVLAFSTGRRSSRGVPRAPL